MASEITELILNDHEAMRRAFARLDELQRSAEAGTARGSGAEAEIEREWHDLATLLDVHAAAEEELVYPRLLHHGANAEDETDDAIHDHNDIRDAVAAAKREPVGTEAWWAAVLRAREANSQHMAEEEREALSDFRLHAEPELREEIGRQWIAFKRDHPTSDGLERDLDPKAYISRNE